MSSSLVGDLTVSDVVLDAAQAHADGAALVTAGRVATWRDVRVAVGLVATGLLRLGAEVGARVALMGRNSELYFEYMFAVTAI
eukprot:4931418-Prymnesium_polylepis.2